MSRREYASQIVNELGLSMGMSELDMGEDDSVSLLFDDLRVTLSYSAEPVEVLWLLVPLAEIDPQQPEPLKALLQLGFHTWCWNRMTIGLDESGRNALGYTCIPLVNLDGGVVQATLRDFLKTALLVKRQLAQV